MANPFGYVDSQGSNESSVDGSSSSSSSNGGGGGMKKLKLKIKTNPFKKKTGSNNANPFGYVRGSKPGAKNIFVRRKRTRSEVEEKDLRSPKFLLSKMNATRADTARYGCEVDMLFLNHNCGVCAWQGPRAHMEDRYCLVGRLGNNGNTSFYGVFDGHGGTAAAEFCCENMHKYIVNPCEEEEKKEDGSQINFESYENSLKHAFLQTDAEFSKTPRQVHGRDLLSGTTAVTVVVKDSTLYVANVGDSRAVLVCSTTGESSENGDEFEAKQLTKDHKPNNEKEKRRIEKAGGTVQDERVQGILSMSRAIGDQMLKQYISSEPDVMKHTLDAKVTHLILGTDGLWDFISNDEASKIVKKSSSAQDAAEKLVGAAIKACSNDNITALVVDFASDKSTSVISSHNTGDIPSPSSQSSGLSRVTPDIQLPSVSRSPTPPMTKRSRLAERRKRPQLGIFVPE